MRQYFISILFLFIKIGVSAQQNRDSLIGDWKCYLTDKATFEFLQLNADGTGIKCFGKTINGKDTLYQNHFSALRIVHWQVNNNKLVIESKNKAGFKADPNYQLSFPDKGSIALNGQHLELHVYPSYLNRETFQRSVTYQKVGIISESYGVTTATCITQDRKLFSFTAIDASTQKAYYKGFDDLIPYIIGCNHSYEYAHQYKDTPYSLLLPSSIKNWSFGFGNKSFYISLNVAKDDTSETSIVIYYDFDNHMKNYYFNKIKEGKEKKDIVQQNNIDIYKTINWQGKYEGKVFLNNYIVIAYYTRVEKSQALLQKCITSFNYQ